MSVRPLRRVALAALLALVLAPRGAWAQPSVAFYDPDANLANTAELRSAMGAFLRTLDPAATFEPFVQEAELRRYLARARPDFVLVNARDAEGLPGLDSPPLLTALREGQTTYTKVLLAPRGVSPASIRVVATTSSPEEVARLPVSGRDPGAPPLLVMQVSKGINALLGMLFQRAEAAYVTPRSVRLLAQVDPEFADSLQVLYRSPPLPNLQLYAASHVPEQTRQEVARAFQAMGSTVQGQAVLELLDYEGWVPP